REARGRDLSRPEERVSAVNAVLPHVARLNSAVARGSWAGRLAASLGIEDELVLQELRAALKGGRTAVRVRPSSSEPRIREGEGRRVSVLLRGGAARARARETLEAADLEGTSVGGILESLLRLHGEGKSVDVPAVLADLDRDEDKELLARIAFREDEDG